MLVDSHCHLDFPDFAADREAVLTRARAAGVGLMLSINTDLETLPGVLAIAVAHRQIYCSVGVHPHNAENARATTEAIVAATAHPKIVGIGETGLDYFYERSPRALQEINFRAHIAAARETGLPLIVHARDADDDIAAILHEEYAKGEFRGLIHCFSSGVAFAEKALDIGFYISFSGILTFKKAENVRLAAERAPLDRVLVETDAPYLAPAPHRGKRNEPAFVAYTAAALANAKGISLAEIEAATTGNFFRLFGKVPQSV